MLERLLIFGAGDLMRRYLLPALAHLEAQARLPNAFTVIAAGRDSIDSDSFRDIAATALTRHAHVTPECTGRLLDRLLYVQADATDAASVASVTKQIRGPFAAYLALPPSVFSAAVRSLATAGLPPGSRLAVEKPFGTDLTSARRLNGLIHTCLPEEAVFRVDHFLGIQTVHNLLGLRFANRVFEPVWNTHHVERVDIIWEEMVTLEGRGYYDTVGALRDMVQNHLLQLLALVSMEPPATSGERELRDRKSDVLRAVRRLSYEEVAAHTVRGRYTGGQIDGRQVRAYVDEDAVDPQRQTETFAEVTLLVDNGRWDGVPFVLRTGKALGTDKREIVVHFRPVPPRTFATSPPANELRVPLDPELLSIQINLTAGDDGDTLDTITLDHDLSPGSLPAYARVLLALLEGDSRLSIRGDEAEDSWEIVEPILDAWTNGAVALKEYAAGSDGPRGDPASFRQLIDRRRSRPTVGNEEVSADA